MPRLKELRFGELFGELHYKFGRTLDGISRGPGALTAEHTYRAVLGYPEVYVTCIYRWTELAIAGYISSQAIQLGKRLGKNVLIVPIEGNEEEFWVDARELVRRITARNGNPIELDDSGVHLLISGYNPQTLLEENLPFLLCDVSELTSVEFVGFFSKFMDLFDVNLESNFFVGNVELGPTAGRVLLTSSLSQEGSSRDLQEALKVLSEIVFVLNKIEIRFCGFQWPIQEAFKASLDEIYANSDLHTKLMRVKDRLNNLKDSQGSDYSGKKGSVANDKVATYQTFIEDIVMGDKYVTGQAGAVGPGAQAHDMTFNQIGSQIEKSMDLSLLAQELSKLREAMKKEKTKPEHDIAVSEVAKAEQAAMANDASKVAEYLKSAGKWAWDVATKIGVSLATEAIKQASGMK